MASSPAERLPTATGLRWTAIILEQIAKRTMKSSPTTAINIASEASRRFRAANEAEDPGTAICV